MFQDPKYFILAINRATGRVLPPHVPLMLFNARDKLATAAIGRYVEANKIAGASDQQIASAEERLRAFTEFEADHPDEMKLPGSSSAHVEPPQFPIAIDGPYTYWLSGGNVVQFVKPADGDTLLPGTTTEEVLEMLIDRITAQDSLYPCAENKDVLLHLSAALGRQRSRMERMAATPAPNVIERFGILMHKCESSNLAEYGYDASRQVLALAFKVKGSEAVNVYHYADVPQTVYDGLIEAQSKGAYAARHITGLFEGVRQQEAATA